MTERYEDRCLQLKFMAGIAFALPPLAWYIVSVLYGLPFPQSISETATIADISDYLLPYCLGAFSLYSLTYSIRYAYDRLDRALSAIMFVGFFIVTVQKCASPFITAERIGLFKVTPEVSHIIHCIGAIAGFGAMIFWIMLCFTKSDKPRSEQTQRKKLRNKIYRTLGVLMIVSLLIFVVDMFGAFGEDFPVIMVIEWVMLWIAAPACAIKGGLILRDKDVTKWDHVTQ